LEIQSKKSEIGAGKSEIEGKKSEIGAEKSEIEELITEINKRKYNEPARDNIVRIYNEIETNPVFGTKEIAGILKCSPSTAAAIMAKIRDMNIVKEVKGKGKGKYIFRK